MPPSLSAAAVPPVETISTPNACSPWAKSRIPLLSETEISARRTRIGSGSLSFAGLAAIVGSALIPRRS